MYRRIELIGWFPGGVEQHGPIPEPSIPLAPKTGLMGFGNEQVFAAWGALHTPRRALNKNCRFFFTEAGWRRYGRPAVIACQQTGQPYRVIRVKEASVDAFYRDELQVAVRPRRRAARRRAWSAARS